MTRAVTDASVPAILRAPHRLLFFIGASNVLLGMLWWAGWLFAAQSPETDMVQPVVFPGWLHAFIMQYQVLPTFFFGFLLTVFPRWMKQPDLQLFHYLPVGCGLFGGQLLTLAGAVGLPHGVLAGALLTLVGWTTGLVWLGRLLWADISGCWHARSCYLALMLGAAGLVGFMGYLLGAPIDWVFFSIKVGTFGLLLPVFISVAHRVFPFFASRVVSGYEVWRPLWVLPIAWVLLLAHLTLELIHAYPLLWIVDIPLLVLSLVILFHWWPRQPAPGLLRVLFWGFSWLPVTFGLYIFQSVVFLFEGSFILGRAPAHALFIGFFGSILIAMVTRVTQGHSGRQLRMPAVAWFAFSGIQLVTIIRVLAEVLPEPMIWQLIAAAGWLLVFFPWVLRIGRVTGTPRVDGQPG